VRCQAVFLSIVLIVVVVLIIFIIVFIVIVIVEIVVIFIFVVIEVVFVLVLIILEVIVVFGVVLFLVFVPPARSHDSGQWERGARATGKLALQTQYLQQINNVRHEKISLENGVVDERD
jgi:energy-coupling factor transporter transmembrane protein EcfT